jgi:ethanolamine utilization cobalamin adenosyltransferase
MKFITEDDLRILFRREPFTSYDLLGGTRLTPGARQFLVDKKISFCDDPMSIKRKTFKPEEKKVETKEPEANKQVVISGMLELKKKTLQAQFLEAGLLLMERDVLLAQQVFDLERKLSDVGKESTEEDNTIQVCTGFHKDNIKEPFDDCFDISGFHAQSEKGKEIVMLHRLRCSVRELAAEAGDNRFNPVINRLSQLICLEYGGKACQRK